MRVVVLLLLLTGCDQLLGLRAIEKVPDGGGGVVDAPVICTATRAPSDPFTQPMACNPWGGATRHFADLTSGGGMLVVAPQTGQSATYAGCTEVDNTAFAPGISIEVMQVLAASSGYVTFHAYTADAGVGGFINVAFGSISTGDPVSGTAVMTAPYDPVAMRWWRLRPDASGTIGEVSPDGMTWTTLGTIPGTTAQQIKVDFGAGTNAAESAPGMAVFGHLDETCM